MNQIFVNRLAAVFAISLSLVLALPVHAADEAADALIQRQSVEVLKGIQSDAAIQGGDISRIVALVDSTVMPNVNFKRMTAAAVGPTWRQASAEQQQRLQEEFKTLMVRTYAGALAQAKNLRFNVKPMRAAQDDKEVVVRTEITGRGDPVQLDYRMEKTPGDGAGWKIYNLNVMGVWLVETYRSQFAQEISAKGIDGLISTLTERNRANSKKG
jgi:phospholipid transport system substrate-binding protein